MTRKDTPFSVLYVLQCPLVVCMNVQFIFTVHPSFSVQNSVQKKPEFLTHHCHHAL